MQHRQPLAQIAQPDPAARSAAGRLAQGAAVVVDAQHQLGAVAPGADGDGGGLAALFDGVLEHVLQ
ncbi:hypothetical protein D3C85_1866410 [compost metagenome]